MTQELASDRMAQWRSRHARIAAVCDAPAIGDRIAQAAAALLGTPAKFKGREPGIALDNNGLVLAACALAGIPAPVLDHRILPASSLLDWVRGVAVEVYHEPVPGDVVFVERASGAAGIGIVGRQSAVSGRPIAAFIILADGRVAYCHHFGIRWCERTQAVRALRLEKFLGM